MPWAAAAAVGGALYSSSASRSAASRSADAAQRATEEAAVARAEAQARLEPWRRSGEQANNKLVRMLGLDGQPAAEFSSDDPSYAFRLQEGQRSVDNSAAARGSTLSGAALKESQIPVKTQPQDKHQTIWLLDNSKATTLAQPVMLMALEKLGRVTLGAALFKVA